MPSAEAAASAMFEQLCPAVYVTFFVTVYLVRELVALTHTIDEDAGMGGPHTSVYIYICSALSYDVVFEMAPEHSSGTVGI